MSELVEKRLSAGRADPPVWSGTLACALVLCLLSVGVVAQEEDDDLGLIEYEIACMPCHGIDGRGSGEKAASLAKKPADLTLIAKANGGVFPRVRVAETIDGRTVVAAHGGREMPVWGARYRATKETDESIADVEERVRAQINALVEFLESIQQE